MRSIVILFFVLPNPLCGYWTTEAATLQTELISLHNKTIAPYEKQLTKKELEFNKLVSSLASHKKTAKIYKQLELARQEIFNTPLYKKKQQISEVLMVLESLQQHLTTNINPSLLQRVTTLISALDEDNRDLVMFLKKERVRLLDAHDELLVSHKSNKQLSTFVQHIAHSLEQINNKIVKSSEYKTYSTQHEAFLQTSLAQQCNALAEKIFSLEEEKEIALLKNKKYQAGLRNYQQLSKKQNGLLLQTKKDRVSLIKNALSTHYLASLKNTLA